MSSRFQSARHQNRQFVEVPRQQMCPELLRGLPINQPITIALFGVKGSLARAFLVDGFKRVQKYFPHVRFVGVDLDDTVPAQDDQLDFPWHEHTYFSLKEFDNLFPEDHNETILDGQAFKIDGVIAAIPPHVHLETAERWAKRGACVWVEKPFVLTNQLKEARSLIRSYPGKIFPVDFFLDSAPIHYLLRERKLLQRVGNLKRFDGRLIENWPLEKGREWLMDPKINGGGLAMDVVVHPLAMMDRFLHAMGITQAMDVQDVVRGRYVDGEGKQLPGKEETYLYIKGKAGDVDVVIDGGKGTDKLYYGISLTGEHGTIEVFTGCKGFDPVIRVKIGGKRSDYIFKGEGIGYGGTFFDFLLHLYGSGKSCYTSLEDRVRAGVQAISYMKEAYNKSKECFVYHLGGNHPAVPVEAIGNILEI